MGEGNHIKEQEYAALFYNNLNPTIDRNFYNKL